MHYETEQGDSPHRAFQEGSFPFLDKLAPAGYDCHCGCDPQMKTETLIACGICASREIETIDPVACLCRCRTCGYVFDNPRPTVDEIVRYYSKSSLFDSWMAEEAARNVLWQRRLRKMTRTRKAGSLLDIGAGTGQFLHLARPFFSEVFGTEVSTRAIEVARSTYGLQLIEGEIENIHFDRQFDNITLFHVLEHVPNPVRLVQLCRELLTDNGLLVVAVPNEIDSIRLKVLRFMRRSPGRGLKNVGRLGLPRIALDGSIGDIHLSHFTPKVLRRLLENNGFAVVNLSLDPEYVRGGIKRFLHDCYFQVMSLLYCGLGVNWYDATWITGRKNLERPGDAARALADH